MSFLLNILFICLVVGTAQACRHGKCEAFCAGEIKDLTKKLTFYKASDLDKFNKNFENPEESNKYLKGNNFFLLFLFSLYRVCFLAKGQV